VRANRSRRSCRSSSGISTRNGVTSSGIAENLQIALPGVIHPWF
jgi:hypothetical protein